ncbi:MAG: P-loop NTPase [Alkalispirochaeta sp.]
MHILPIASGKGGVGKSLFAANLGIALAQAGKRVVLADLDLGGSNLHMILGLRGSSPSIGTFLGNKKQAFEGIIHETDIPNLRFIPGDAEIPGLANINAAQKKSVIRRLSGIPDVDYLVLDLGAGTSHNILDFFLMSSRGIIITTPTPTATVNAYLFLKNALFRVLQTSMKRKSPGEAFLNDIMKNRSSLQRVYIPEIVDQLEEKDPESAEVYRKAMTRFQPRLVMNMIEDPKDAETVTRLRRSAQQYLGLDILHLGVMYRDELQTTALNARIPILRYKPSAVLSQAIYRISEKIVQLEDEDSGQFLDIEAFNDSYDSAESEAEHDFDTKLNYIEELLNTGALSMGDLVETVKSQQFEITQLRRQNNLYKAKLVKAMRQGYRD